MISQRERGEFARFYTVTDPTKHPKGYTVYKVTARIISRKSPEDVQEITVSKRYSDFRTLHQNLWQLHKSLCSQSELFPPFAKAKVFGRFDESVIETRRQCSEDLLQFSANIPALYSSQHIQDFFKGGDVHDGSELIGPAEPFSDFLADSLSDCSSEVNRDLSGADDWTFTSEYGGPTSESDLTSLVADTDSLGELDDGMASGRTSPNQPPRGAPNSSGSCSPFLPGQEASRPVGRSLLFSGALRRAAGGSAEDAKPDYLDRAGEHIQQALRREAERDYQAAFSYYRSGVDLLLQGVQGEPSPTRREAVKKRTAEYLMRAELIANQYLRDDMGQGSTQTVVSAMVGAQCCPPTSRGKPSPAEELRAYRVLGVIDKVSTPKEDNGPGLQKSSDCGRAKGSIMPSGVPNMVRLRKFIVAEDTVYLLLQYAEGGKLWSHIGKFLRCSSPDDSFDIPFIQKSHTTAVHSPQRAAPAPQASASEECTNSYLTLCNEYEQDKVEPDDAGGEGEDRSKHTPMEFFRIDSKDSASEVICLDVNVGGDLLTSPKPLGPDPDSKLREEELPEMAREVTGLGFEPWGLDPSDDAASNESVPVISFKEAAAAAAADEGPPPDLLVNLPAGGGTGGTASESEAPEAPGACRRPGPDVLQLHGGPEDAPAAAPPAPGHKACQSDPSVPYPAPLPEPDTNTEFVRVRPDEGRVPGAGGGGGGAEPSLCPGDPDEGGVARLFAALDELTLAAAHVHIPEEFVRCWAVEMVTALDALHQEGVVCRDLNPNNILVNHQGHIQLTYFCSWSDVEDSYDKEAMANMYCAPEVGGISEETAACDWWSLGAILFELLTGKSLLQCHPAGISRHTALSVPDSLTEEAGSLLGQLLQFNPMERLGSGGAGADDIKSHPFFAGVDWSR
uniref:Non-specific serine/threonine protein kinase n=1 Tax=Gadus morhua TaxID=8049 RepID=A0A8C5F533_GADMO